MEEKWLTSRIDDLCRAAERGIPSRTDFLGEEEQRIATGHLRAVGFSSYRLYGGWEDAERKCLFVFPDWFDREAVDAILRDDPAVMRIRGSGYYPLDHRSCLGAILALGVRREYIGDILIGEDDTATVMLCSELVPFFAAVPCPLETVGRDRVRVTCPDELGAIPPRRYQDLTDTVASARLDCIVASLTNLAREKAQGLIRSGTVFVDGAVETRCDAAVEPGDVISVRHCGKFKVDALLPKPKGDRLRLLARKYL